MAEHWMEFECCAIQRVLEMCQVSKTMGGLHGQLWDGCLMASFGGAHFAHRMAGIVFSMGGWLCEEHYPSVELNSVWIRM